MDASAYLTRHGWTGGGLGFQQSGIKKPILATQKHSFQKGLGGKPLGGHSDQWWLGAFDAGLKNLGSDKPAKMPALSKGPAFFKAELYRNFIKGEGLTGTMSDRSIPASKDKQPSSQEESSKESARKHQSPADVDQRKERKLKKDKKRQASAGVSEQSGSDERLLRQMAKKERRALKEERRAYKEARRQAKIQKPKHC